MTGRAPTGQALAKATPANAVDGPSGFDPSRVFADYVGRIIDHPSLYMGGPSRDARRKAEAILNWLRSPEGATALAAALDKTSPIAGGAL